MQAILSKSSADRGQIDMWTGKYVDEMSKPGKMDGNSGALDQNEVEKWA